MIQIAIIGAGQLGSRHLQALMLLGGECEIHVVDPSELSRETARQRSVEVKERNQQTIVHFHAEISALPRMVDLVIIATNSDVRKSVTERLLEHSRVKFLILEKVLFQALGDYAPIEVLLKKNGVQAWVNCPRREWPFYHMLKEEWCGKQLYDVHVSGSNWGLGCNAIHMIDLIAFLSSKSEYLIYTELLDPHILASKRNGFIEFSGVLTGRFVDGPSFSIASYAEGNIPDIIHICGQGFRCMIRESEHKVWFSFEQNGWQSVEESFEVPYQSGLTHLIAEKIFSTGNCGLPLYSESALLHKPLLRGLTSHMLKSDPNRKREICPVT